MIRRFGLPTSLLWPTAILALIGVLGSQILILPHDFWWHMKIGEVIASTGEIPRTDTYSFTRYGTSFVYQSWLSELLLYELHRLGGLTLIVIVRNGLLLLTYALIAWQAQWRTGSWPLAA